jgi:hypothetical protein
VLSDCASIEQFDIHEPLREVVPAILYERKCYKPWAIGGLNRYHHQTSFGRPQPEICKDVGGRFFSKQVVQPAIALTNSVPK